MTLFVICDSALPGRNDGVARGIVCRLVFIFVTPPSYGHFPYILLSKTPRNAAGHSRGERDMHHSVPVIEGIIPSLLAVSRSITGCFATQNIGEVSEGRRG